MAACCGGQAQGATGSPRPSRSNAKARLPPHSPLNPPHLPPFSSHGTHTGVIEELVYLLAQKKLLALPKLEKARAPSVAVTWHMACCTTERECCSVTWHMRCCTSLAAHALLQRAFSSSV